MKRIVCIVLLSAFAGVAQEIKLPKKPVSETHFGKTIVDDYRYMENNSDTLVQKWFKQNGVNATKILNEIDGRKKLVDQMVAFENRKTATITILCFDEKGAIYYLKKEPDNTTKLYCKDKNSNNEVLLFDPLDYKRETKNNYVISYAKVSWDNRYLALSFTKNGEEIGEIAFYDLTSKKLLSQIIPNAWPSEIGGINWLPDNSGITYSHFPVIDPTKEEYIQNTETVLYKIEDDSNKHKVLFSKNNNNNLIISSADFPHLLDYHKDDKYVLATLGGVSATRDTYSFRMDELNSNKINYTPLFKKEDGFVDPVIVGDYIYCLASKDASNYKIIRTKITNPDFANPEIIVPENKEEIIDEYAITPHCMYFSTMKNGVEAKLYKVKDGIIESLNLPIKVGRILIESRSKFDNDVWFTISGWLNAKERFGYDPIENKFFKADLTLVPSYPEFKDFVVEEIEIPSHDGVMMPVSLVYKKSLKKNKLNNVLIYGYGAYGRSLKPSFQTIFLTWVLNGGVFVVSHVRGGGEKGDNWHKKGFKKTKFNTWKDLIATTEYLIKNKITNKNKTAILSASAGGILVGRAMTERPDLFKVVMSSVGDLNAIRMKDTPNGPNNMKEFGDPDIEEEFNALYEMDAYHHVEKGVKYPACLINVGMNDARVAPSMSGKFVAKLRENTASKNPILFSVNYESGHKNSNLELINEYADKFAFALWQMGHPKFQLKK
jgi:prolyl oligopeptidase